LITLDFLPLESFSNIFIIYIAAFENCSGAIDENGDLYLWSGIQKFNPILHHPPNVENFVDLSLGYDGRFAAITS
jgi:hypothetical protein